VAAAVKYIRRVN